MLQKIKKLFKKNNNLEIPKFNRNVLKTFYFDVGKIQISYTLNDNKRYFSSCMGFYSNNKILVDAYVIYSALFKNPNNKFITVENKLCKDGFTTMERNINVNEIKSIFVTKENFFIPVELYVDADVTKIYKDCLVENNNTIKILGITKDNIK